MVQEIMETNGSIEYRLIAVAREVFPDAKDVSLNSSVNNTLGWDSLGNLNFIFAIEEEFGIDLFEEETHNLGSIKEILAALERRLNNG